MFDGMAATDPKERLLRLLEMAYEQYAIEPPMPMPDTMASEPMPLEEAPEAGIMLRDKLSADVAKKEKSKPATKASAKPEKKEDKKSAAPKGKE